MTDFAADTLEPPTDPRATPPLPLERHLGTLDRVLETQRVARLLARLQRRRLLDAAS